MAEKKEFTPALGYDWLTGFYDLTVKLTMPEKNIRKKLIEKLAPKNEEIILEFGFGTGQNLLLLQKQNEKAILLGLDIDPKVRAIAKRKITKEGFNIPLDLYDGRKFPYADKSFDKVFSSLVFHHLNRQAKLNCLKEIYRVLKPNGQIIIGDWGQAKSKIMRIAFYTVQFVDGFKTTSDNVNGLLPEFIKQTGFVDVGETDFINTKIGTYCYYKATKPITIESLLWHEIVV